MRGMVHTQSDEKHATCKGFNWTAGLGMKVKYLYGGSEVTSENSET